MKKILFFLFFNFVFASEYTKQLNELFSFSNNLFKTQNSISPIIFNQKCKKQNNISNQIDLERYKFFSKNLGIFVNTNGYINNDFKTSLSVGIKWNLLNNGYKENQDKAKMILLKNQLTQKQNYLDFYAKYNMIIYYFNQEKLALLQKYSRFLKLKFEIFRYKYWLHSITLDKLLLLKQSIKNNENLLKTYKIFNSKMVCKKKFESHIFDFDLDYYNIINDIEINKTRHKINNKLINLKYDEYDKWNFNVYANQNLAGQTKIGFGISIPIEAKIDEIKELEKLNFINKDKNQNLQKYLFLQKNYYLFRYQLNKLIKLKYKLAYLKAQLNRSKLRYKFKIGSNNIDNMLQEIDNIFQTKFNILEIKQQMVLQTYNMMFSVNMPLKTTYIKQIHINTNLNLRKGNRSLYIWANGFKMYQNDVLIDFLKTKNIKRVIVSVSKNEDFDKLSKFLKLVKGIKVEFLVFDNSWLFHPENIDKKLQFLNKFNNYNLNIFLPADVIKTYHTKFIEILKYITTKYPKYKINVTIPYLKDDILNKIKLFVDGIYSFDVRYKDVNLILDCSKYANELELEMTIDDIVKNNKNISLYDLKTYIKVIE